MAFGEVGTSLSKIKANSLNLAGTYGFSGTVSGLADETPLVLISTFTSDGSDATASFTSGIDSTYKEYLFVFNNIHPENNATRLQYNLSVDGGSNYNVAKTTTSFKAYHDEGDSGTGLIYETGTDLAQGTGTQYIGDDISNANDSCMSGKMILYNPSSTTFVKQILIQTATLANGNYAVFNTTGTGYANTTSAINAVQFSMSSGEIQGGTIDMFGVV